MSQMHAMSDDQVSSELKKMTAFIRQEALEKAREIQLKADEEFAIEKSKLVRSETSSIDASYEKKFKQAGMSQQITRSTVANKTRLRILTARQELIDDLFEKARGKLGTVGDGKDKGHKSYPDILKGLLLEGLYALNEKKLLVRGRKKDYESIKKAIKDATAEYKQNMSKETTAEIDEKNPLPDEGAGGLSIVGSAGKIDITNTFEERLKLLQLESLPQIRNSLFGENQNRHFTD